MCNLLQDEKEEIITSIKERLRLRGIDKRVNYPVKEGYKEALRILSNDIVTIDKIPQNCNTVQGRFIAWLAVDYLLGDCDKKTLLSVKLK